MREQFFGDGSPELFGSGAGAAPDSGDVPRTVGGDNHGPEFQLVSGEFGEGTDRQLAAAAQSGEGGALASDALAAGLVVKCSADAASVIVFAGLNGERALSGGRTELFGR